MNEDVKLKKAEEDSVVMCLTCSTKKKHSVFRMTHYCSHMQWPEVNTAGSTDKLHTKFWVKKTILCFAVSK